MLIDIILILKIFEVYKFYAVFISVKYIVYILVSLNLKIGV